MYVCVCIYIYIYIQSFFDSVQTFPSDNMVVSQPNKHVVLGMLLFETCHACIHIYIYIYVHTMNYIFI